jgi:hypothetical protein
MKRMTIVLAILAILTTGAMSARAQMIVDYRGHLWEETSITAVGLIQSLETPLTGDMLLNEYTWVMEDLVANPPLASMTSAGYVTLTGGRFSVYEDPSQNADYGVNPANATSPSTFQDGTLYLTGSFLTLTMWWDPVNKMGNFNGVISFDGGTHLAEVNPSVYKGWTFAGTTSNPYAAIPDGYFQAVDGQVFIAPVPTDEATWGEIKNMYADLD